MEDKQLIQMAKDYCILYHNGQIRRDGEPYHTHPIAVQKILKKYGYADKVTQCVALLHDVFEDTEVIKGEIKEKFGYEIANGIYILSRNTISEKARDLLFNNIKINPGEGTPREIVEKLYKMRLSFARRKVLRVKIADMIHNTQDLQNLNPSGIKRKLSDAHEFYIPMGNQIAPEMIKELKENIKRYKNSNKSLE